MQKKKLKKLSAILLLLMFNSCAQVPDVPVCTRLDMSSGFCVWTISKKELIVTDKELLNGKTWLDLVIQSVYIPADSWVEIKSYIIKNCKKNHDCNKEIDSWKSKLDKIDLNLN